MSVRASALRGTRNVRAACELTYTVIWSTLLRPRSQAFGAFAYQSL